MCYIILVKIYLLKKKHLNQLPVKELSVCPETPNMAMANSELNELAIHSSPAGAISVIWVIRGSVSEENLILGIKAPNPRRPSGHLGQRASDTLPA